MWIIPQPDDVLAWVSSTERVAITAAATQPGQDDRLTTLMKSTVDEVRGYIGACERFREYMGPVGTIPEELVATFWAMVMYRFLHSLPIKGVITEDRRIEHRDAYLRLQDVAKCLFEIAPVGAISGEAGLTMGGFGQTCGIFIDKGCYLGPERQFHGN